MTYSIKQIQNRYKVSQKTVLDWIHGGLLVAVDVSTLRSSRPHFRITPEALAEFEERRRTPQPA